jgi:hypothetical protein
MSSQLTLGHVVKHRRDHVCLLDDLLDDASLTQKTITSLVLPITKILAIEDQKLHCTFLHVAFGL